MQTGLKHRVGRGCADVNRFSLPPHPGVSNDLREWMYAFAELKEQGKRLQRLKILKEERLREELEAKQEGATGGTACRQAILLSLLRAFSGLCSGGV